MNYNSEHVEKKEKMASVPTKSFRYKFWSLKISNFLKWKIIINNRKLNIRLPITYLQNIIMAGANNVLDEKKKKTLPPG